MGNNLTKRELQAMEHIAGQTYREVDDAKVPKLDHSSCSYDYARLNIPYDSDGYTVSFDINDDWKAFFDEYGFVIVKNCLTSKECQNSENEVWDHLKRHYAVERADPKTWENETWPNLRKLGILGDIPVLSPQLHKNRYNSKIQRVYREMFGCDKLIVAIERIGMMRPVRDVNIDGKLCEKSEWASIDVWCHIDMCPWTWKVTTHGFVPGEALVDYDQLKVQAMVALKDCGPEDGGLRVIPGFHKHIRGWARINEGLFRDEGTTTVPIPREDPIVNDLQRISLRAGSLCIFRSELPHDTRPCNSSNGRLIQYVKMAPASDKTVKQLIV